MSLTDRLIALPSRPVLRSILLGVASAKLFTSVPAALWESSNLGWFVGFGFDLAFAFCLTGLAPLFGWSRAAAWQGGVIALASFSLLAAAALIFWQFGHEPTDMLDLWLRWFRLTALSAALVGLIAAVGPPVVLRTDS